MFALVKYWKTKYGANIPSRLLINYFEKLTKKIYKILPLYEDCIDTLTIYIQHLQIELNAANELLIENDGLLDLIICLEALNILQENNETDEDYQLLRSQVFICLGICKEIIQNLNDNRFVEKDGDDDAI